MARGVIRMRVPITCMEFCAGVLDIRWFGALYRAAAAQLLSGGLLLGAVFMAHRFYQADNTGGRMRVCCGGRHPDCSAAHLGAVVQRGLLCHPADECRSAAGIQWLTMLRVWRAHRPPRRLTRGRIKNENGGKTVLNLLIVRAVSVGLLWG